MSTEPAEHARFARYLDALAEVPEADEIALVAAVLADPDRAMTESAVARHVDRRADALLRDRAHFEAWAAEISRVIAGRAFVVGRLREWALWRSIVAGDPGETDALLAASNWLQLKAALSGHSPDALTVLAEGGRTRRVRSAAARSAQAS